MSGAGYKITNAKEIHVITFAVVEWVDVFTRKEYRDILFESIRYCLKEKGLKILGSRRVSSCSLCAVSRDTAN